MKVDLPLHCLSETLTYSNNKGGQLLNAILLIFTPQS